MVAFGLLVGHWWHSGRSHAVASRLAFGLSRVYEPVLFLRPVDWSKQHEPLARSSWMCPVPQWLGLGLKFIRRAFSGVNLAFGMLTRECFLECTFNWLDYSTGIKDETQTHCFTGFSRMVSLVIPNVGFASLLTQSPHLILGCAWTAATLLMALQGLVCPVEV